MVKVKNVRYIDYCEIVFCFVDFVFLASFCETVSTIIKERLLAYHFELIAISLVVFRYTNSL